MILLRFLISLLLISLTMIFASCGNDVESDQGRFTFAINYYSQAQDGDSVLIAGTKNEPGINSPGWALYQSVNGAWGFSIGDGSSGFIYQPTPERQSLTDGKKHGLAFAIDTVKMEIRWWFDGRNVAIYNVAGLDFSMIELGEPTGFKDPIVFYPQDPVTTINVMAWNIWHGGRESGLTEGVARVVDVIKQSQADIICMVETYGSGPIIADSLGYYFYLRSSNLSIMSRFPIGETVDMFRAFNYGGAEVWLSAREKVMVHPLWIHYLPDMNNLIDTTIPVDSLLKWEWQTRGNEMKEILAEMQNELAQSDQVPVIMAGDYNSPSHLDWDSTHADLHQGRIIEWPVSRQMIDAGMIDAYRRIHPNPRSHPGHTWSPIFQQAWQDRIDYVYYQGEKLDPTTADVISSYPDVFPSDHAAVIVTFIWNN
jgi:endonuclease/exonuclease/phosphatase (EEP) superfamily protein YafD